MSDADVDAMSLKELKAIIAKSGLSSADCLDKSDLRARAREAVERLASASTSNSAGSGGTSGSAGSTISKTMGGYPCIVKGPADLLSGSGTPADMVMVVLHGLGATNSDLAEVPAMLAQYEPSIGSARLVQIFPQAPQTPIGTAWLVLVTRTMLAPPACRTTCAAFAKCLRLSAACVL